MGPIDAHGDGCFDSAGGWGMKVLGGGHKWFGRSTGGADKSGHSEGMFGVGARRDGLFDSAGGCGMQVLGGGQLDGMRWAERLVDTEGVIGEDGLGGGRLD